MLDFKKDKYIIVEIIPTNSNSNLGSIVQIQALKIEGLKLLERFDYRLNLEKVLNSDLRNMISYDKYQFTYVETPSKLLKEFKKFIGNCPLLIIDNDYTLDYLREFKNKKESVFKYLDLTFSNDVFEKLMKKYNLEASNHLVDLLYESLIYESNNK